ncbi:MAG TPA: hypothetical protein DDW78_06645 [Treponema sp.]|nr:hypothetical protein [Treponema sp.]
MNRTKGKGCRTLAHKHITHSQSACVPLAALLLLGTLCLMLLSEPLHAGHDCTGHDCPVCASLLTVRQALGSMDCTPHASLHTIVPLFPGDAQTAIPTILPVTASPVTRKTRMNN